MKVLKVTESQHARIVRGAKESGYSIRQFTGAMIDLVIRKFESGEIKLAPVSAEELPTEEIGQ
jgi:hypothetical protein